MVQSTNNETRALANPKLGAIFTKLIHELNYQAPQYDDTRPVLEAAMLDYATGSGIPYESGYSQRCFDAGLSFAFDNYPSHPFAVKLHIAIYTWLAIYIDDDRDGTKDLEGFQTRFHKGEPQPSALLERFAETLRAMSTHFDPFVANLIVLSTLQFVNATLMERRGEFLSLKHCKEASRWPDYFRDRSGVPEAFAYFAFPKDQCPDIGAYMQVIPDIMTYLNYANDVLSFHKETIAGETDNYINTRAVCEQRDAFEVLETVASETIAAHSRVVSLLRTRSDPVYARKWDEFFNGYIWFHLTARRYKLHVYPGLSSQGVNGHEQEFENQRTSAPERSLINLLQCA